MRFDVESTLRGRLSPTLETVLYRVGQEALTNVVKHSEASNAWVRLARENGSVILEVGDDGRGLDAELASERAAAGHFGLISMRQRIEMVGGAWEVGRGPKGGTLVRAVVRTSGLTSDDSRDGR